LTQAVRESKNGEVVGEHKNACLHLGPRQSKTQQYMFYDIKIGSQRNASKRRSLFSLSLLLLYLFN